MNKKKKDDHFQTTTKESVKESKKSVITLILETIILSLFNRFAWFETIMGNNQWFERLFSVLLAANLFVILETLILTKIKWNLFYTSRRTSAVLAILVVVFGSMLTVQAHELGVSDSEIVVLSGFIALNAGAVLLAAGVPKDKILLKSIMVTMPIASMGVAIGLSGLPIMEDLADHLHPANLIIENDCQTPIEYLNVNIKPFGTQTIPIPSLFCTIDRDMSGIVIRNASIPGIPQVIKANSDTIIVFDGNEIRPGSKNIKIYILPESAHNLVIRCRD